MTIRPDNTCMKFMGRMTQEKEALYLAYSASYIEFEAVASRIGVTLVTDREPMEEPFLGQVAVFLDDVKEPALRMALRKPEETVTVFEEAVPRRVRVRLVKMSEAAFGLVGVKEFEITGEAAADETNESAKKAADRAREGKNDAIVIKTPARDRKIEFIGDSITCGYGNEGVLMKDTFTTAQENPLDAYAVLTAEALDADYQLVSWSGTGIISNYVDPDINEPCEDMLMPMLYPYRDRALSERMKLPLAEWSGTEFEPELIVINIGTNDDSYVRKMADRQEVFGEQYEAFLETVHAKNPRAAILGTLGMMGQNLCEEEECRIRRFAGRHPGVRADYIALPEQLEEDGIGADFHPSKITHRKSSAILAQKIREFMGW